MAAAGAGDFEVRCATGANGGQGMNDGMKQFLAATVLFFAAASAAWADNRTTTGALTIDPPTLIALGFAWNIEGDDNRNARVTVNFRKKGAEKWQPALDLMRLQNEQIWTRGATDLTAPNQFAGSIFDLDEATDYEVKLGLADPDGVSGEAEKVVTVRTRAEPKPATGGHVFHVYPPGFTGKREQPAFSGLLEAYYMASLGGDWSRAPPPRVRAGDVIKVHAGLYPSKHDHYSH